MCRTSGGGCDTDDFVPKEGTRFSDVSVITHVQM